MTSIMYRLVLLVAAVCCCGLSACRWKHIASYRTGSGNHWPVIYDDYVYVINGEWIYRASWNGHMPAEETSFEESSRFPTYEGFGTVVAGVRGDYSIYYLHNPDTYKKKLVGFETTTTPPTEVVTCREGGFNGVAVPLQYHDMIDDHPTKGFRFINPVAVAVRGTLFIAGAHFEVEYRAPRIGGYYWERSAIREVKDKSFIAFNPDKQTFSKAFIPNEVDLSRHISLSSRGDTIYMVSNKKAWRGTVTVDVAGVGIAWHALPDYPGGAYPIAIPGGPVFAGGVGSNALYAYDGAKWKLGPSIPLFDGVAYPIGAASDAYPNQAFVYGRKAGGTDLLYEFTTK